MHFIFVCLLLLKDKPHWNSLHRFPPTFRVFSAPSGLKMNRRVDSVRDPMSQRTPIPVKMNNANLFFFFFN